jgi:ABC-type multidrug transport system ATPase subunit
MLRTALAQDLTLLVAAETLDVVEALATRVALMADGRITATLGTEALLRSRAIELTVAAPAQARRILGARVSEAGDRGERDPRTIRLHLHGTSAEAILAECRASGIRVERSRIVIAPQR